MGNLLGKEFTHGTLFPSVQKVPTNFEKKKKEKHI